MQGHTQEADYRFPKLALLCSSQSEGTGGVVGVGEGLRQGLAYFVFFWVSVFFFGGLD